MGKKKVYSASFGSVGERVLTVLNSRSMSREIVDTQAKNHSQLLNNDHSSLWTWLHANHMNPR